MNIHGKRRLAWSFPEMAFVPEHAGMLKDMLSARRQLWRDGMTALAERPNVNVKLSGLGTFVHACRGDIMGPIVRETVAMFGAERCLREQFSDRKTLDRS